MLPNCQKNCCNNLLKKYNYDSVKAWKTQGIFSSTLWPHCMTNLSHETSWLCDELALWWVDWQPHYINVLHRLSPQHWDIIRRGMWALGILVLGLGILVWWPTTSKKQFCRLNAAPASLAATFPWFSDGLCSHNQSEKLSHDWRLASTMAASHCVGLATVSHQKSWLDAL